MFFDVRDRKVVVVGGTEAGEKAALLLIEYGARVTVIGTAFTAPLRIMGETGIVKLEERPYAEGDLADAWIIICADADESVNALAHREAENLRRPVTVLTGGADRIFEIPPTVRRDPLQIAVSTNDAAPGFAERVVAELEEQFGPEYTDFTDLMGEVRDLVDGGVYGTDEDRAPIYADLLDSNLFDRIKDDEYVDAELVYKTYVKSFLAENAAKPSDG